MSIVASNSYRFNMSMDFWLLKDFTAKDLIDNWNRIINYARDNESDDNTFFLRTAWISCMRKSLCFRIKREDQSWIRQITTSR